MVSRSAILSSIGALVLSLGCDTPPKNDLHLPDGGIISSSNAKPNPIITNNPDGPPGPVDMTPPTAADADATQQLKLILHGMNVGNFLDATPQENSWSNDTLHTWFFQAIKEAGFDHVRIPVRWNVHTAPDYTIDPTFFARVDWAIGHTLSRNMAAMLDIHHYDEYYANPVAEHDKFIALWKQIAEHYKNYPKNLFFEILNEPQGKQVTAAIWNADMTAAVAEIRKTNPYRTLVIGGIGYNNIDQISAVNFPAGDKNVIATYHYYNPYCFTIPPQVWDCQGRGWDEPYPHSGAIDQIAISWPVLFPADIPDDAGAELASANNERLIDTAFGKAAAWSQTSGIPIYVGEFGADSYNRDVHARAAYIGFIVQESEKYGFGWANWSLIHTFSAWNGSVGWYPEIIDALTGYVQPN
jgi:endoglucanase